MERVSGDDALAAAIAPAAGRKRIRRVEDVSLDRQHSEAAAVDDGIVGRSLATTDVDGGIAREEREGVRREAQPIPREQDVGGERATERCGEAEERREQCQATRGRVGHAIPLRGA